MVSRILPRPRLEQPTASPIFLGLGNLAALEAVVEAVGAPVPAEAAAGLKRTQVPLQSALRGAAVVRKPEAVQPLQEELLKLGRAAPEPVTLRQLP